MTSHRSIGTVRVADVGAMPEPSFWRVHRTERNEILFYRRSLLVDVGGTIVGKILHLVSSNAASNLSRNIIIHPK